MKWQTKKMSDVGKKVVKQNLVKASSGNISFLDDSNEKDVSIFMTSSGVWLDNIDEMDIVKYSVKEKIFFTNIRPTSEYQLHIKIYENSNAKCVLHHQSEYATILSAMKFSEHDFNTILKQQINVIPEVPCYINSITKVNYITPGSIELAETVGLLSMRNDFILLKNHGQISIGKSFEEVIQKAVFFELAAKILIQSNFNVSTIDDPKLKKDDHY